MSPTTYTVPTFDGRVNPDLPAQPTPTTPSASLFADRNARTRYWLADPPGPAFPALQAFWLRLSTDITEYRRARVIQGPRLAPVSTTSLPDDDAAGYLVRLGRASRESRSPNWSGVCVAAVDSSTLTQVVGSWVEPIARKAGSHTQAHEFRSSLWVGYNGHAAYLDASLPQIGTLQRIAFENGQWQTSHWAWFEWWANTRGRTADEDLLPFYLDLDVRAGDTVLCRIDLIASDPLHDPIDIPYVARMCICVERAASAMVPARKVLVMPFVVYPPEIDAAGNRSEVWGCAANWIAELPTNVQADAPFLLPQLTDGVSYAHCAAASAFEPGAPLIAEHTLEVSNRFHLYSREPRGNPSLAKIATCLTPRTSDTQLRIQVDGNDA